MKQATNKRRIIVSLAMVFVLVLSACAGDDEPAMTDADPNDLPAMTLSELATYDGQDGRPAYIAVDGVVYDVTDDPAWGDGMHHGRFEAGHDYSDEIRSVSPHGTSMLDRVEAVAVLADD